MKSLILSIFLLSFAVAASGQAADAKYLVKLKGVGLGSKYSDVIRSLGQSQIDTTAEGDECHGGKIRTLVYDGMQIELAEPSEPETEYYVVSMGISTAKWQPFGVKIGATQAAVKRKLGNPTSQETDADTGERIWYFEESGGPSYTNFYFKNGKLIRIYTFYIC